MKIAIVCFNVNWPAGGPRLLFSSARAWEKQGHRVVIYVPEFTGRYFRDLWEGLDIRAVKPKESFVWEGRPSFFKWIIKKIKHERLHLDTARRIARAMDADFDLVNLHDYAYRAAPSYRKRNPKAKILWSSNDPPYTYLPKPDIFRDTLSRLYNWWRDVSSKKYFRAIDATVVLDDYNREWCKKRGIDAEIVYLGVDYEKFHLPLRDFRPSAKEKRVNLFSLGALNVYRRYADTIMAAKILRAAGYKPRLNIIANDTWHESAHREELVKLVRENKLEDIVTFHFEGADHEGIIHALREAHVFVYAVYLPPPRDGFGFSIAVIEAIAAGLPVVICRTTTSQEVLKDGETALFVDPMSPEDIAAKVKLLVDHPDQYEKIAAAGQKLVKERLTWDAYARQVLDAAFR